MKKQESWNLTFCIKGIMDYGTNGDVLYSNTAITLLQPMEQTVRVWTSIWYDMKRFMNCNKLDKK